MPSNENLQQQIDELKSKVAELQAWQAEMSSRLVTHQAELAELERRVLECEAAIPGDEPTPDDQKPAFGVDVSHWQGRMDWSMAAVNGVHFAFMKASEGKTFADSQFATSWQNARTAGILRGAYHFYRFAYSPIEQADHFLEVVGTDLGELPLVVDVEDTKNNKSQTNTANDLKKCLEYLEQQTGRRPIIYTAAWWWNPHVGVAGWENGYPLWVANYTSADSPTMPRAWQTWLFWQFTSTGGGNLYGTTGSNIDQNWFNGSFSDLQAYANSLPAPAPPAPSPTPAPTPVPPPTIPKIDMLSYLRGNHRQQHDVDAGVFTQTYQSVWDGDGWFLVKGGNGQYEYLYFDDNFIYRREDTSQGNDRFLVHFTNGVPGAIWCKRFMTEGETVSFAKEVTHFWNDCSVRDGLERVPHTDTIKFVKHHSSFTFGDKTLSDVVELEWVEGGQNYWFARGFGLVGFTNADITAEFMDGPLGGRADLPIRPPNCIDLSGRFTSP
jgi:GH25 family lysozyme M1 (1,4-beta-N-acetylmuramidase)